MNLWENYEYVNKAGQTVQAERAVRAKVKEMVGDINRKVVSRGVRAVNAIRNAELEVLKGQRSGRVYRKPFTKRATYTASAPGEPPARRTGNLRMHWNGQVKSENTSSGGVAIVAELESQESYAGYLENGTSKMAARPFVEKIKEEATPEIQKIYSKPYT
mgnify:CR=1 FL=1